MSKIDDGGSAFPVAFKNEHGFPVVQYGMSLRQWYAGLAMQGQLACGDKLADSSQSGIAKYALQYADALIVALREKP